MPPLVIPEKYDKDKFGESKYERAVSATDYWLGEILKNINLENTIVDNYVQIMVHLFRIIKMEQKLT